MDVCDAGALLARCRLLISLDDYRPQIEQEVSDNAQGAGHTEKTAAVGLPLPHVVVEGIEIGRAGDLKVGTITVTPDLLSLLTETKIIRSIEIERAGHRPSARWKRFRAGPKPIPRPNRRVHGAGAGQCKLDDALLQLQKESFGPFDASVALTGRRAPEQADITARDGKFKATIRPAGDKFDSRCRPRPGGCRRAADPV